MTSAEWGLLLLLSLLWGGSFFFIGVAVKQLPPLTIVFVRVSLAAALLWASAPLTGLSAKRIVGNAPELALLGLINNALPFALIVWAQTHLASGLASILNATTPMMTVIVAHMFTTSERLSLPKIVGAACGFVGVAGMIGPDVLFGHAGNAFAEGATLAAALSYALASVFARRFRERGLAPIEVAAGQVTASCVLLAPLAFALDRPWSLPTPDGATVAAVIALAVLSTAFAYIVYFRILAGAGATNVVLVTLLAPVTSIALGAALLGEQLGVRQFVGLFLIAAGIAFIDGRLPQALGPRAAKLRKAACSPAARDS
ncbi:MAG: DMT family transporter [Hyphomicrobiales bacterium]|nr:DMT family transporter [Hyphomicrobiales bacterium]